LYTVDVAAGSFLGISSFGADAIVCCVPVSG